jgi:hypothetical protein
MADERAMNRLGTLCGQHLAIAAGNLYPPEPIIPLGMLMKQSFWSGATQEFRRFVVAGPADSIDFPSSVSVANQWLGEEINRKRTCALIFDGYLRGKNAERRDCLVQKIVALKDRVMVDVFYPYYLLEDNIVQIEKPICEAFNIDGSFEPTPSGVNLDGFIGSVRHSFSGTQSSEGNVRLWA